MKFTADDAQTLHQIIAPNLPMTRPCCTAAAGRPIRRSPGWSGDAGDQTALKSRAGDVCDVRRTFIAIPRMAQTGRNTR